MMTRNYGYAGKILKVDLTSRRITSHPTMDYARRFLGGRGIAAKIYWDEVPPEVRPFDSENILIFATGPLAGFKGLAGSRWQICGKSPAATPELFSYSNLGGNWGARLKFTGHDALIVRGKSERPIYLSIEKDKTEIKDASHLWGKGAREVRGILKSEMGKSAGVVACGPAGENRVLFATTLADNDASGSAGFGAVMGSKMLKAVVVRGSEKMTPGDPDGFQEVKKYFLELSKGTPRVHVEHPSLKRAPCFGCPGCARSVYQAADGTKGKVLCQSGIFYQKRDPQDYVLPAGKTASLKEWDEVPFFATRLCDDYGLDTNAMEVIYTWLTKCYRAGLLTDESTGIPLSKVGAPRSMEVLIRKTALREDFGDLLAQGISEAAASLGKDATNLIADSLSKSQNDAPYCPRTYITTGLFYAMEPRQPIHQLHEVVFPMWGWLPWANGHEGAFLSSDIFRAFAKKCWGSEIAADFSTWDGKAFAAKKIQDRQYVRECLIMCDFQSHAWFIPFTEDHSGDSSLESRMLSAVTGENVSEEMLYETGERVFNLQRAILVREGHAGRKSDVLPDCFHTIPIERAYSNYECLVPGKDGQVICKRGELIDRNDFERLKTEYYQLRDWDVSSGLQTKAKLEQLNLRDVAEDLSELGLAVEKE